MSKSKGILIATAVATTLVVTACSQKIPTAGTATMSTTKVGHHHCKSTRVRSHCKAHSCKANQCKGKNGQTCNATNGCSGRR